MADVLVVFYPRSKVTERAARWIANDLEADVDRIPELPEHGPLSWPRRAAAALRSMARPASNPRPIHLNDYAVVVVGTPVWDAGLSSAVRTYLKHDTLLAPEVAFFCTSRDDGGDRALERMAQCARRVPVARLALAHQDVAGERKRPEVDEFVRVVRARVARDKRGPDEPS